MTDDGGGVLGAVPGGGPSTVGDENAENVDDEESAVGFVKPENVEALGSGTGRGVRTGRGVAPPSAALATR